MGAVDPMSMDAVARFEEAAEQARREDKRVKAILLCSPNNPLGMLVSAPYPSLRCGTASSSDTRPLLPGRCLEGLHEALPEAGHTSDIR
jgi:hypothetical protein